jgi:DNA-binding transcriptional regulator YdaS (Cro superfamily)
MRRGRVNELAKATGLTKQAISAWTRIPAERAPAISEALGVPLHELRPDLWPVPEGESAPDTEAA